MNSTVLLSRKERVIKINENINRLKTFLGGEGAGVLFGKQFKSFLGTNGAVRRAITGPAVSKILCYTQTQRQIDILLLLSKDDSNNFCIFVCYVMPYWM